VSITYTWTIDTEKPIIATTATNSDLGCNPEEIIPPVFTLTEACSPGDIVVVSGVQGSGCVSSQTWIANFTDACGNVADALSITYTWTVDTEPPVITGLPEPPPAIVDCSVADEYLGINYGGANTTELVVNGDFSNDNPASFGFTSEYTYRENIPDNNMELWGEGQFAVGADAFEYHPRFFGHGAGGSGDNFMIVNGYAGEPQPVVWQQTITGIVPGQLYYLSAWARSLNDVGNNANLKFSINDVQVGVPTGPLPDGPVDNDSQISWTTFYAQWTATATTAVLKVVDLTTAASGNDFGLDNISFGLIPQISATDNCSDQIPVTYNEEIIPGTCVNNYTVNRSWTATDFCDNTTTVTHTFTVVDNTVPVIAEVEDIILEGCNTAWPDAPTTTWSDNCSAGGNITGTPGDVQTEGCTQYIDYTFNVIDECDNAAEEVVVRVSRTYDVTDPVFEEAPANVTYACISEVPAMVSLTWTDNCGESGEVEGVDSELDGGACGGIITRTWSVEDACGNAASISQLITINDETPPALTNNPPTTIVADCGTVFDMLPWQLPEFSDNCGTVVPVSDVIDPPAASPLPATYTRTWTVTDECGNLASFEQTIQVNSCEQEFCTVTQYTLGSETGSFCDGTSSYDLMESLLIENGPMVVGIPANNRTFTVPVVGGAQCVLDHFPSTATASVLTGNYSCSNFGNLLLSNGIFNNSLLVEAITMQFNLWMTPDLGDLLLESSEFYIRSASGCGGDDYPMDDSTHYQIHPSVYNYLGTDPTVQDLFNLANLALGTPTLPGPNVPTLANIKFAIRYINQSFENCGFIYFIPPASNKIQLVKTGVKIDNAPIGIDNPGDQISYSFTVSNVGNLTLENVFIDDPLVTVIGGPIASLAPGVTDNTTFTALYDVTQADIDAGSFTNTATVFGTAGVNAYMDTDSDVQFFTQSSRVLNVTVLLEGLYAGPGVMRQASNGVGPQFGAGIADQITVELHNAANYNSIVFSNVADLSVNGQASVTIPSALSGSYYVTIRHRNSLETTSSAPVSMSGGTVSYAFDAPSKAYGGNLLMMITGEYVIFGGDVNQDGVIDTGDMTLVDNSSASFTVGYVTADVNGDGTVDTSDMTILDNNASGFVVSITP